MLGINIYFISGNSMNPLIPRNVYVLSLPFLFKKINSVLIFRHKKYGDLIKRLNFIDEEGNYWFKGENDNSLSTLKIGPIKEKNIVGRALLVFSKNKTFLL